MPDPALVPFSAVSSSSQTARRMRTEASMSGGTQGDFLTRTKDPRACGNVLNQVPCAMRGVVWASVQRRRHLCSLGRPQYGALLAAPTPDHYPTAFVYPVRRTTETVVHTVGLLQNARVCFWLLPTEWSPHRRSGLVTTEQRGDSHG